MLDTGPTNRGTVILLGASDGDRCVGRKSYEFHQEGGVTWSLVFDPKSGVWHIEKTEQGGPRIRMTLDEFEASERGKGLGEQLGKALRQAEQDV